MAPTPAPAELTCQQAADRLGVSLAFLMVLLDTGLISFRDAGSERRLALHDILAFQRKLDEQRHAALDELATQAQQLDMGY